MLDGRHLRQVLLNLLGNAIKFTRGRRSAAGHHPRRPDGTCASRSVDTGPGIEPEALTEIFAAFAQTKAGAAAGGTGLGLTICDHLISEDGRRC